MKKIVNYRPLFYMFLALFGAILFAKYIFLSNYLAISFFIIITLAITITCVLRKRLKTLIAILLCLVFGILFYAIDVSNFNDKNYSSGTEVYGKVESVSVYNSVQYIVLSDVKLNGENFSKNVKLKLYGTPYVSEGEEILLSANLTPVSILDENEKIESQLYKQNCYYQATKVSGTEVTIVGENKTFAQKIRFSVKEKLLQNMSEENAETTYAILFGDKSGINSETKYEYQTSGIAHILAVSGLHVGLICAFLFWIMKKCKAKNWVSLLVISIILIFYCYLCSFTPSVVRATLMTICLLLAKTFGKKYDSLSAIGIAGILILIINPLFAFDVGFQLSFGCVIGIAIFYKSVYTFLRKKIGKFVLPNFIAKPISISLSTQFLILPVLINCFDGVSFLSIFANLIVIPIFTIAFTAAFIATPLIFISAFFGNIFWFSNLLLNVIGEIAKWISIQNWSIIPNFKFAFSAFVLFFALLFVLSRLFLTKKRTKLIICLSLILIEFFAVGILQLT